MSITMPDTSHYRVLYSGRNRKQFLAARSTGLGASDLAAVLGFSSWKTPHDVWLEKTGRAPEREMTEAMEMGIALENPIAQRIQVRHGRRDSVDPIGRVRPSPGVLQSKKHPHLLASIDRLLEVFEEDGRPRPLEIKTQNQFGKNEWEPEPPMYYQAQSQGQQLVFFGDDATPEDYGFIVPLIGGNLLKRPIKLPFDPDFAVYLVDDAARWWRDYVVADKEPPLTLGDDVNAKRPPIPGLDLVVTPELRKLIAERNELQPKMSADKKRDDAIKAEIKLAMESHVRIVDDNGAVLLTWDMPKTPPKVEKVFDEAAFRAAHPALAAEFTTQQVKSQSRTMYFK